MKSLNRGEAFFAARAVELYTALLAAGETEISRRILETTMNAAAAVARLARIESSGLEQSRSAERRLCEELLKKSLFWICQVPDTVARSHGGELFRETLRLLLWLRD